MTIRMRVGPFKFGSGDYQCNQVYSTMTSIYLVVK